MTESPIIIALDYPDAEQAMALARRLDPQHCRLKVGLELYLRTGGAVIPRLHDLGFQVFLDLKFHDIPNTVAQACRAAAAYGVWMITVHALGGRRMLQAARESLEVGATRPRLVAVTLLTSHSEAEIKELGLLRDSVQQVSELAALAQVTGLDGVVCSPHEAQVLRQRYGDNFLLVTPGIRMPGETHDDQSRVMSARQAQAQGASYLVVGRSVTRAPDPALALKDMLATLIPSADCT